MGKKRKNYETKLCFDYDIRDLLLYCVSFSSLHSHSIHLLSLTLSIVGAVLNAHVYVYETFFKHTSNKKRGLPL